MNDPTVLTFDAHHSWKAPRLLLHPMVVAGILVASITLIARLPFLVTPGWSVDSYNNWAGTPGVDFYLAQGRPGQYVLVLLTQLMGVGRDASAIVLQTLGVLAFAAAAPLMFTTFIERRAVTVFPVVLCALLFTLHPFQAEILTFPEASFYVNLSIAAGVWGLWLSAQGGRRLWLGVCVLAASMTVYQLVLNYAALMILFGVVMLGGAGVRDYRNASSPARRIINALVCVAVSTLIYFALAKGIARLSGVALLDRASVLGMHDLGLRIQQFATLMGEMVRFPLVVPSGLSRILLAVGAAAGVVAVVTLHRRDLLGVLVSGFALILMPVAAGGVILVGSTWWPVPRVLGGYTLIISMLFFAIWAISLSKYSKAAIGASSFILLIAFAGIGASIHADQKLINEWDRHLASTLYARAIELAPDAGQLRMEVVNRHMGWAHPIGVASVKGDMNVSAFLVPSSIPGLFAVTSGRAISFVEPSPESQLACDAGPFWPSAQSMRAEGNLVKVCL